MYTLYIIYVSFSSKLNSDYFSFHRVGMCPLCFPRPGGMCSAFPTFFQIVLHMREGGEVRGRGGIRPAVKTHIPPPKIHIHTYRHPIYTKSRTQREWGTFFQVATYCLRILHSAHKLVLKYGIVHGLV